MKTSSGVPAELLYDILDALETICPVTEEKWCSVVMGNLRNCALVHRSWTRICQVFLKHHIRVSTYPQYLKGVLCIINWDKTIARSIGPSTRSLALTCHCDNWFPGHGSGVCPHEHRYNDLVGAAPELRNLLIGGTTHFKYSRDICFSSALGSISNLQMLRLNQLFEHTHLPHLFQTLNNLPQLRTLSFVVAGFLSAEQERAILTKLPKRSFPLKRLCLYHEASQFPFLLLAWLLRPTQLFPDVHVTELKLSASLRSSPVRYESPDGDYADALSRIERIQLIQWSKELYFIHEQIICHAHSLQTMYLQVANEPTRFRPDLSYLKRFDIFLPSFVEAAALDFSPWTRLPIDTPKAEYLKDIDQVIGGMLGQPRPLKLRRLDILVSMDPREIVSYLPKTHEECTRRLISLQLKVRVGLDDYWVF